MFHFFPFKVYKFFYYFQHDIFYIFTFLLNMARSVFCIFFISFKSQEKFFYVYYEASENHGTGEGIEADETYSNTY